MRARDLIDRLTATYLTFDARSLGLFRILLGLVLLADVYRRWQVVDFWYTDDGIISRSSLMYPRVSYLFTFFLYASTHGQAVAGMLLCAVVYGLFTIGFRTRLFQILSLVCAVSLNNRLFLLENGGQFVLQLLCAWTLFLPLGRRFSVDAALGGERNERPVVSLAVLGLLLQFGAIYLFNVLHKTGVAWRDGSAVYYTLHDERLVTALGVWVRETLPAAVLETMSHATLLLDELGRNGTIRTTYPYPIQAVQFGDDLTLVALAGETVVDYSLRLKLDLAEPAGSAVWVAGYSNDVFNYVPSLRVLQEGGYEGVRAISSGWLPGPFDPSVEKRIVDKVHELVKRVRSKKK